MVNGLMIVLWQSKIFGFSIIFIWKLNVGGVEQFISNYYHHSDFTLEAFRDLELTISKDYLQAAINIYPNKRIEMYSNQEISNQLDQIDEQYYADHEIEYFDFIDKYTEGNIVKMGEIMFKIGAFSKLTQATVRMLRYYDEMGLLKLAAVD